MAHERRGDRRPPPRPAGGGGFGERRPYRPGGPGGGRPGGGERDAGRFGAGERDTGRFGAGERDTGRFGGERAGGRPPYQRRPQDEGGMAIRIDPRRLNLLKELAGEEGLRPGQLVQRWVEERLDAEREGRPLSTPEGGTRLAALEATMAALAARLDALDAASVAAPAPPEPASVAIARAATATAPAEPAEERDAGEERPRRRGRPPKRDRPATPAPQAGARVPLHEEIIAVIAERGASTAAEIADAIRDRGRYSPPRSSRPLDAATVNSRVSNPVYRARFVRSGRRIGLAG